MATALRMGLLTTLLAANGCATAPLVRWLDPAEMVPHGSAPGARHRLLASHADGSKDYALILASGDEVASALAEFARSESVTAARFTAIGAVRDPEVGWFDASQKKYKAMRLAGEQCEVVSLVGDVGLNAKGAPVVHTHVVLGRTDGSTFGGHFIGATTSPTLEMFVTTFAHPLRKKVDGSTDLQLFDLASPEP
jgi:predicted DNA-binding protein with PD1-like motif